MQKSTDELISFGFSNHSVRSLVSANRWVIHWDQTKNDFTFWLIFGLSPTLGVSDSVSLSERLIQTAKWPSGSDQIRRIKNYWKECSIDLQEWLKGFSSLPYTERLLRLGLWTPEERRNRCDLTEVFKMFYGFTEIDIMALFTLDGNDEGSRGHSKKICKPRFNTNIRKYFFLKPSHWQMEQIGRGHCWSTQPELFHKQTE